VPTQLPRSLLCAFTVFERDLRLPGEKMDAESRALKNVLHHEVRQIVSLTESFQLLFSVAIHAQCRTSDEIHRQYIKRNTA
jgi:hypothetical protein